MCGQGGRKSHGTVQVRTPEAVTTLKKNIKTWLGVFQSYKRMYWKIPADSISMIGDMKD